MIRTSCGWRVLAGPFKARNELLKEYKQGLLIEGDVDQEIELCEESLAEAKASTFAAKMNVKLPAPAVSKPNVNKP